ncbi:MAG: hypothetical protein Q9219_004414 [cf. Caloplaca sp. 3 TL-2023]
MPLFTLPPNLFNRTLYTHLLSLWFSTLPPSAISPSQKLITRWFGAGGSPSEKASFDSQCADIAGPALEALGPEKFQLPKPGGNEIGEVFAGELDDEAEGRGQEAALALILLLDQMPRNIFRDRRQSVVYTHYDFLARAVARIVYARGMDRAARWRGKPAWRVWFYMPMMHSEDLADHDLAGAGFEDMKVALRAEGGDGREEDDGPSAEEFVGNVIGMEGVHRGIVERFGRYPHRNEWIGREGSVEERGWLDGGGARFGTG